MLALWQLIRKYLADLPAILKIVDVIERFLSGEEVDVWVSFRGIRLHFFVDLSPLSLRVEVIQ